MMKLRHTLLFVVCILPASMVMGQGASPPAPAPAQAAQPAPAGTPPASPPASALPFSALNIFAPAPAAQPAAQPAPAASPPASQPASATPLAAPNTSAPVPGAQPAAQESDPSATTSSPVASPTATTDSAEAQEDLAKKVEEPGPEELQIFTNTEYKSMLFKQSDADRIKEAGEAYKLLMAQRKQEDYVSTIGSPQQSSTKVIEHPQFYLASIVYHNPEDWAVWINDNKYTSLLPSDSNLIVSGVDKDSARIIWRPVAFSNYKDKNFGAGGQPIIMDQSESTITFTLYTNQTFSAFTMKIHEGMLPPVYREVVNLKPQGDAEGNPVPEAAPNQAADTQGSALTRPDSALPQAPLPGVPVFQPPKPQTNRNP